eukprot:s1408_g3.t3
MLQPCSHIGFQHGIIELVFQALSPWNTNFNMHPWEDTFVWLAEQAAAGLAKTKTYNVAITACGKGANWPAALTCFQQIFLAKLQPDVVTYNSAITACTQGTSWPMSLLLFFELLDTGRLEPDSFSLSAALCACAPAWHSRAIFFRFVAE